jgi:serine/threonine protein kinase
MVLDLVPGGDLYTAISSNTLTNQREIDCLFAQIVRAVGYMHARGVAHRDLKPENMLWDPNSGMLKIIDFGSAEVFAPPLPNTGPDESPELAALFDDVQDEDRAVLNGRLIRLSRNVCGSAPYIAPEEFLGEGYDSRATDVWACAIIYLVGCVLCGLCGWLLFLASLTRDLVHSGNVHPQIPVAMRPQIRRPIPALPNPRLSPRSRPFAIRIPQDTLANAAAGSFQEGYD